MNFELTPNTGTVFKVQNKPSDKLPDYEGHVNIEGKFCMWSVGKDMVESLESNICHCYSLN